jgi:hypothetical protein
MNLTFGFSKLRMSRLRVEVNISAINSVVNVGCGENVMIKIWYSGMKHCAMWQAGRYQCLGGSCCLHIQG